MIITLEPFEVEWVYHVGLRRHHANLHKADASHYDPRRMQDNTIASIAAAACELAVAKATCCYWPGSVWDSALHDRYREAPDVFPDIEVRRVRERTNPLVVRRRDADRERAVVVAFASPDYRTVDVRGWENAKDAWDSPFSKPAEYDRSGTRLLDQKYIRPIDSMFGEVSHAS